MRLSLASSMFVLLAGLAFPIGCGLGVTGSSPSPWNDAGSLDDAAAASTDGAASPDGSSSIDAGREASTEGDAREAGTLTVIGTTTVSGSSLEVDRVRTEDGPIKKDDEDDGVFDVTITGPAIAIALLRCDANGTAFGQQIWDTWVGNDTVPAALASGFSLGSTTYQLGVYDDSDLLNDKDGRVTLADGTHTLRLYASDVGSFESGSFFRVVVEMPSHELVLGPPVAY